MALRSIARPHPSDSNGSFLFFFDRNTVSRRASELALRYRSASPFPHVVIDDFLPDAVVRRIAAEFPAPDAIAWKQADRYFETKLSTEDEESFPDFTRHVMHAFNSSVFVEFLEQLTGIQGLIPDPHFRGGGLHQIRRTGKLGVHADFNYYERLRLHRRINVLLYLNEGWKTEYGGQLELWNRDVTRCEERIDPVLNRCVIFSTTDESHHGHPEPLACPESMTRKSLAFYYYTAERPEAELTAPHTTIFHARPGEAAPPPPRAAVRSGRAILRSIAEQILPPVVVRAVRNVRRIAR